MLARYTKDSEGYIVEDTTGEFVRFEDIEVLLSTVRKLVGRNGWDVSALMDASHDRDSEEIEELLSKLEREAMKIEED